MVISSGALFSSRPTELARRTPRLARISGAKVHRRVSAVAVLALFSVLLSGCSRYAAWQYSRAQKLEAQGKHAEALAHYLSALNAIPETQTKLRSQAWTRVGECYWRSDRLSDAFGAYERAATYDVANFTAQLRVGEIFLATGSPERAGEKARFVLTAQPENPEALALLGAAASASGNTSLAQLAYERALEVSPNTTSVSVAYADLLNRDDKVKEARAVLAKAIELDPKSADPWLALGRIEEQEGNTEAAETAYRRAVTITDDPETNLRLAQFLERSSRIDEARALLRHVDTMRPLMPIAVGDSELNSGRAASALESYLIGIRSQSLRKQTSLMPLYMRSKRSDHTDVELSRASLAARVIEADLQLAMQQSDGSTPPRTSAARLHLDQYRKELDSATINVLEAEIALAENDISNASVHASAAVTMAPDSAPARYVSGLVKYRTGDRSSALEDWAEAIKHDPNFVPARLALASHELRFGSPDSAEDYVVQTVRDEPGNVAALTLYARVLAAQKHYDSAEIIAKRAMAVDKASAEPHILLGDFATAQKKYAVALAELEQAVLLEPHNQHAIEALTRVYNSGVITRPLLARFEKIANADPPSATLMEVAGRLYAERSWSDDARRCFQRALQIDPSRDSAKLALARLEARTGHGAIEFNTLKQLGGESGALLSAIDAEQHNDIAAALKQYEIAIREGERNGVATNNLAWLLAQKGDLDRALAYGERAYKFAPHDPAVLDTLGYVFLKRREYSQAVILLQEAKRIAAQCKSDPERPGLTAAIREHLWEAYLRSGDTGAAAMLNKGLTSSAITDGGTPAGTQEVDPAIEHPKLAPAPPRSDKD
jgi:tetratricopeptide (TPR) repeat protein